MTTGIKEDDEFDDERDRRSQRLTMNALLQDMPPSSGMPAAGNNLIPTTATTTMTRQFVGAVLFGMVGWYGPKYVARNEQGIARKVVPFQTTLAGDIILDSTLNLPLIDPPTISGGFLIKTSVWFPIVLLVVITWWFAPEPTSTRSSEWGIFRRWHSTTTKWLLQARICALCTGVGLSEGITQLCKLFIQRRRPNFYQLCGWDDASRTCTASLDRIHEAHFSFPSGHSSLSASSMTVVMWICGAMVLGTTALSTVTTNAATASSVASARRGTRRPTIGSLFRPSALERLQFQMLAVVVLPMSWTIFVGASRIRDYWHHPSDVVAGLLLGFVCGTIAYHLWFPPWWWGYCTSTTGMTPGTPLPAVYPWSWHIMMEGRNEDVILPTGNIATVISANVGVTQSGTSSDGGIDFTTPLPSRGLIPSDVECRRLPSRYSSSFGEEDR